MPAARPDGLGATVAGSVATPVVVIGSAAMLVVGAGLGLLGGAPWYAGAVVVVVAALAAGAVVATGRRRHGGVTGDVLGAVVEVALATALVVEVVSPVAAG